MSAKAVYREMTVLERDRALALVGCRLPPASMTKRFARGMAVVNGLITEKQAAFLAVCCYRFRRQIVKVDASLVPVDAPAGYETPTMVRARRERVRLEYQMHAV